VTGVTGSGKSTTLACMLNHLNALKPAHILTIEDPIEFLYSDQLASISQVDTAGVKPPKSAVARL